MDNMIENADRVLRAFVTEMGQEYSGLDLLIDFLDEKPMRVFNLLYLPDAPPEITQEFVANTIARKREEIKTIQDLSAFLKGLPVPELVGAL